MRNCGKKIYFVLFFTVLLSGCWSQHDVITIKSNGTIEFKSKVTITEEGFSTEDVDELTTDFVNDLKSAGWQVSKKWISYSEPFKLSFSGRGNLHKIESVNSLYQIRKINNETFKIRFSAAETRGGKSSRSIVFKQNVFGGAKVMDIEGNVIREIKNVFEDKIYEIEL